MLQNYGNLITIHARKIAMNALRDAEEAENIIFWHKRETNDIREKICMLFASRTIEGSIGQDDCPGITLENIEKLKEYVPQFQFE